MPLGVEGWMDVLASCRVPKVVEGVKGQRRQMKEVDGIK